VTGVQTCALPISDPDVFAELAVLAFAAAAAAVPIIYIHEHRRRAAPLRPQKIAA